MHCKIGKQRALKNLQGKITEMWALRKVNEYFLYEADILCWRKLAVGCRLAGRRRQQTPATRASMQLAADADASMSQMERIAASRIIWYSLPSVDH